MTDTKTATTPEEKTNSNELAKQVAICAKRLMQTLDKDGNETITRAELSQPLSLMGEKFEVPDSGLKVRELIAKIAPIFENSKVDNPFSAIDFIALDAHDIKSKLESVKNNPKAPEAARKQAETFVAELVKANADNDNVLNLVEAAEFYYNTTNIPNAAPQNPNGKRSV